MRRPERTLLVNSNLEVLDSNGYMPTIEIEHLNIHKAISYVCTDYDADVDNPDGKYFHIATLDKSIHMSFLFWSNGAGIWSVTEDAGELTGGTDLSIFNLNRNSATKLSSLTIKSNGTQSGGTTIYTVPSGSGTGGSRAPDDWNTRFEFILKKNTNYNVYFFPASDNSASFVEFFWYEI
jgi:hypothetical protein